MKWKAVCPVARYGILPRASERHHNQRQRHPFTTLAQACAIAGPAAYDQDGVHTAWCPPNLNPLEFSQYTKKREISPV